MAVRWFLGLGAAMALGMAACNGDRTAADPGMADAADAIAPQDPGDEARDLSTDLGWDLSTELSTDVALDTKADPAGDEGPGPDRLDPGLADVPEDDAAGDTASADADRVEAADIPDAGEVDLGADAEVPASDSAEPQDAPDAGEVDLGADAEVPASDSAELQDAPDASDVDEGLDAVDTPDASADVGLAPIRSPTTDEYLGIRELPVANDSGFFRPALLGDRWVLATPSGHAFLSFGPTTIDFNGEPGRQIGYSPFALANRARFGEDEAARIGYFESTLQTLRTSQANTVGGWSDEAANRIAWRQVTPMPYTVSLGFAALGNPVNAHAFPDVFAPDFASRCRDYAVAATAAYLHDPYLIGYFTDNELRWWGGEALWPVDTWGLADDFLLLPPETPGKQAWVAFLKDWRGYADTAALDEAWGLAFASWDEVAAATAVPADPAWPKRSEDKAAFIGHVARTYFETVDSALRAADPDHLNLCIRFATTAPIEVVAATAPCDILTLNDYYSNDDDMTPELFQATPEERWTSFALAAGGGTTPKPTMLTEFGLRGMDSMLPNGFGAGFAGPTQVDRGIYYRQTLGRLLGFRAGGLGFVVGFHWFELRDEPKTGRWDGEDGNYGLLTVDGARYEPLWQAMRSENRRVVDRLMGGSAPVLAAPVVRVESVEDGAPVLRWEPVPGADRYEVRLAQAPWMPGAFIPAPSNGVDWTEAEIRVATAETRHSEARLAAGSWWAEVTAHNTADLAFPSDASLPVRFESKGWCPPELAEDPQANRFGCLAFPAPMDSIKDDGWVETAVAGGRRVLRFRASALAKSHPRNGGDGVELTVTYTPPAPLAPDALPGFCNHPVIAVDGIREPSAKFLRMRMKGPDGALLYEGPLDPDGLLGESACTATYPPVASGPVASMEWGLRTGDPRLPLDVPVPILVSGIP